MTRTFWECSSTKVGQLIVAGHSLGGQYAAGFKPMDSGLLPPNARQSRAVYPHDEQWVVIAGGKPQT